jgi:hypothetical protein
MSKAQSWMLYFNEIDMLNASGHEFSKEFVFERGFIFATCARCGQGFRSRYGAGVGPYDTRGARDLIRCDNELAIRLGYEKAAEVAR